MVNKAKTTKQSPLILIGGGEDRKYDKMVLKTVVEVSKAENVVLIPSASSYPREVASDYYYAFRDLGVKSMESFDIRDSYEADNKEYFEKLTNAQLAFFSGGDQTKLFKALRGSKLLDEINRRFQEGTLCIAGTSAGAAAASNPMIYDGDYRGFQKDTVNYSEGFGWLPDITVDTHFMNRGRIARLSQFLSSGRSQKGIGLDEDTAVIITHDLKFEVVGTGMVTILSRERNTNTNYDNIGYNENYSVNNLRVGFLSPGSSFSLNKWMMLKKRKDLLSMFV